MTFLGQLRADGIIVKRGVGPVPARCLVTGFDADGEYLRSIRGLEILKIE